MKDEKDDAIFGDSPNPKISVVCFTHNRPLEFAHFLTQLNLQTFKDWELIVMDESDEKERSMNHFYLATLCQSKKEVTYFWRPWQKNWGQTSKEEAGITLATGDWLIFPNDDVYWAPVFFEKAMNIEELADLIMTNMVFAQHDYNLFPTYPARCRVDVGGFLIRREIFRQVKWRDKTEIGDGILVEDAFAAGAKVKKVGGFYYVKN